MKIQKLSNYEAGKIEGLNFVKDNILRELQEIGNQKTGYFLRESRKDALYAMKTITKQELWNFMLRQIENEIKITLGEIK